jgi:hypothetical protein
MSRTVPHIIEEGSRRHVISYQLYEDAFLSIGVEFCSEPNCEINREANKTLKKHGLKARDNAD